MERKERYFHECPHCGLLTPWIQRKCDCGYRFRQAAPGKRVSYAVLSIVTFFAFFSGFIVAGSISGLPFFDSPKSEISASPAPAASPAPTVAPTPAPTPRPTVKPTPSPTPAPAPTPRPVLIFNGTIVKDTLLEKPAPLTVETSGAKNYLVVLRCIGRPSSTGDSLVLPGKYADMSFYVSGGQTVEVSVPLGEYEIYYATGDTWYGDDLKFGDATRYYKCDETFLFERTLYGYSGWTVTLYPVYNGNMETEEVDAASFPD